LQQSGLQDIRTELDDIRGRVNSSADITLTSDERDSLNSQLDNAAAEIERVAKLTGNDSSSIAAAVATAANPATSAASASDAIDQASQAVSQQQTTLAADEQANLGTFQQLYQDQTAITSDALSKIEDTDYAAETANLVQSQTMTAGAMAALTYSGRERADQIKQVLDAIA
jgi:flagellin-like hook-associated protein FlgL